MFSICSLILLLPISLEQEAITGAFHLCLTSLHSYVLHLQSYRNYVRKFQKIHIFGESRFGGSEKDRYFLKILKWQHKLSRDFKRGKLVSYFLHNAAKTCLHGLKISENIEIEQVFQSRAFFISVAISTQVASAPLR